MKALSVNLIPRARLEAQRVSSLVHTWAAVLGATAALLAIAYAALLNTVAGDAEGMEAQMDRAASEHGVAEAELKAARAELASASRLLSASQEVRDHPDWSALLGAMAAMRGDDLVLGTLDLSPVGAVQGQVTVTRPSRYMLRMSGLARNHRAATTFSLMLEETGVFERVTLTNTSSQMVGERPVVVFAVECSLDEIAGAAR
jgi:hypothetical protein